VKVSKRLALGAAAIAAVGIAVPSLASNNGTTKSSSGTQVQDCGNGHSVSLTGPEVLFPPNHKMVNESATASGTNPTDLESSLTITPTVQDVAGGDGGPTHDPDFAYPSGSPTAENASGGTVTEPFQLRAERSGKGDGRTYVINWMASWDEGAFSCSSSDSGKHPFTVTVPHDQGNH
jgi:hypothetical protein